jgi:hypothetical protein
VQVCAQLETVGLSVAPFQTRAAFAQFDVADEAGFHVALDRVADPFERWRPSAQFASCWPRTFDTRAFGSFDDSPGL